MRGELGSDGSRNVRLKCVACGRLFTLPVAFPVYCSCGLVYQSTDGMRETTARELARPPRTARVVVSDDCRHRGAILGELGSGCCGRPAVLSCARYGRCTRSAVRTAGPIVLRLLDDTVETLGADQMPAVCRGCVG
jgi:hypothetical protein